MNAPLGERVGLLIYRHFTQYMAQLPIPSLTETQREQIRLLVEQLTEKAKQRYSVRWKTAQRIQCDLGSAQAKLNKRLDVWWELSFQEFRDEIRRAFGHDIRLKERDAWEEFLQERRSEIVGLTNEIVRLEQELNSVVYAVFGLSDGKIQLIEQETKFSYGEW